MPGEEWNVGILTYQVSMACGQQNLSGLTKLKMKNQSKCRGKNGRMECWNIDLPGFNGLWAAKPVRSYKVENRKSIEMPGEEWNNGMLEY
jgi:hypothetical protein